MCGRSVLCCMNCFTTTYVCVSRVPPLVPSSFGSVADKWVCSIQLPFRAAKDSYKEPLMIKETYSDEVGEWVRGSYSSQVM